MPYTIGFGMRGSTDFKSAEKPTAREALALVDRLERSDEEIKFIKSDEEGEIGKEMLALLAAKEMSIK